ncbi:MAG: CysB family HTH-type transcriptional regulator [Rubrivivax sp.]|nr:CysB family HTH-type transcriptional regulator [Betaproteobacteria bacterium]MBP6318146.1 CysB family HTH-type transcriptional regulator [Rubrivivax sp.]MBK7276616.1 CysB family HTH-type transcriptional regulator [Betaproteobacteria bacterium]MBK7458433.1 CysB family HTH-type transcriptional regulator [Betaproteobacteria bacterium]MBK7517153.1 CysB family HTH-type transcriptional regulator [Betaproteobacteria bacterium]
MNLHQFRFVQEAVRRQLNLTETAKALHTSQPGISKAILELEEELGIDIFARYGKRLKRVTEPGEQVLKSVEIIMREVANLRRIGDEYSKQDTGTLSIATTHTQARYFLPRPVAQLRQRYPKVQVVLHQGMPEQVAQMLLDDVAEIGLATEALGAHPGLITLPCYEWQHVLVVPAGHSLAGVERPTLEQLAAHTLVLYHRTVTGRTRIDEAFSRARLEPVVALEAIDSDVIKTYVRLGLGVGIVAEQAMSGEPADADLAWRPLGHLFGANVARLAFKRGAYLRQFVQAFAELLSPRLSPPLLAQAMGDLGSDYQL